MSGLCNKGCGFNTPHTTGFHDTWSTCVQNNQPFTLPDTHVFQNKMLVERITVTQVASNNVGDTHYPPPINGSNVPDSIGSLHHMGSAVIYSQNEVKEKSVC